LKSHTHTHTRARARAHYANMFNFNFKEIFSYLKKAKNQADLSGRYEEKEKYIKCG